MTSAEVEEPVETTTENSTGAARITAAPYMPGPSFTNSFGRYATDGLPDVFDKSFFGNISGSTVAQTRATMKYFDLIDDEYAPTQLLRDLVDADEDTRKGLLKMMMEEKYTDALALSPNATAGQLAKVFNERGITGATVDKAISFYLHMLDYVGIGYSQHFKKRRPSNGSGARRRKAAKQVDPPPPPPPLAKPKATTAEEQRAAYVQTLLDLAKKDGTDADSQDRIFDRIEKALGIANGSPAPTPPEGGGTTDSP